MQERRLPPSSCASSRTLLLLLGALLCCYFGACCSFLLFSSQRDAPASPAAAAAAASAALPGLRRTGAVGASAPALPSSSPLDEEAQEAALKAATRAELGRGTWNLLHRMAAAFDKQPTPARQQEAAELVRLLGQLYPCPDCAEHFRQLLQESPPDTGDNKRFSLWLCSVHNSVNERLGKPLFPCELEAIKERWGSCGCFGNSTGKEGGEEQGKLLPAPAPEQLAA